MGQHDMDLTQLLVLAFAAAASSVIKNGAAVGAGIFLLPVLALVFPPKIALGLGAPIMLASDIMGLRNYWGEWDNWPEILRIILAASIGIACGGYFIHIIPGHLFKRCIGGFAICFSLYNLLRGTRLAPQRLFSKFYKVPAAGGVVPALVIGYVGGVATVLAHAGGMVWSMYYATQKLEKRRFVATMIMLFALSNLVKLVTYVEFDILSLNSTLIVLAMTPLVYLSSNLGNMLNRRMDPVLFRRVVLVIILVLGGSLLV